MTEKKVRFDSIDTLKGFACIAIILIHTYWRGSYVTSDMSGMIKVVVRFAVPLFFCISGFFLSSGRELTDGSITRKIRHVMRLIVGAAVFYLAVTYIYYGIVGWGGLKRVAATSLTALNLAKLLLTQDPLYYKHLWFLFALLLCYITMMLYYKPQRRVLFLILGPALIVLYTLIQEFSVFVTHSIVLHDEGVKGYYVIFANNFLLRGLPFFLLGVVFREAYLRGLIQKFRIPLPVFLIGMAGLSALAVVEYKRFDVAQCYISNDLQTILLMTFCLQRPQARIPLLQHIGRDLSMYIYITHRAVYMFLDLVAGRLGFDKSLPWTIAYFPAIMVCSIIVSELYFRLVSFISSRRRPAATVTAAPPESESRPRVW